MFFRLIIILSISFQTLASDCSGAIEPGQPGSSWTKEELEVTRSKIEAMMDCQENASELGDASCWEETEDLKAKALRKTTLWANTDPDTLPPQSNGAWVAQEPITVPGVDENGQPTDTNIDLNVSKNDYKKFLLTWNINNQRYLWRHRGPRHSRLIQLAFHDCLRYSDGTGGCDGCLNWDGMGWTPPSVNKWGFEDPGSNEDAEDAATGNEESGLNWSDDEVRGRWSQMHESWPLKHGTDNNKLQLTARSLELIYESSEATFNWPPGSPDLKCSLKNSGKSRADLWAFAGQVGLERAMMYTNINCQDENPMGNMEFQLGAIESIEACKFKLDSPVAFRFGRKDCIPDPDKAFPFMASKKENHANAYGTGKKVIQDLKDDFGLEPQETISLMAVHSLANFGSNPEHLMKYRWIGGSQKRRQGSAQDVSQRAAPASFSNMYYKILNGQFFKNTMGMNANEKGFFIGDALGNPVRGAAWGMICFAAQNRENRTSVDKNAYHGGPCHFKASKPGCAHHGDKEADKLRLPCFRPARDSDDPGKLVEKEGEFWKEINKKPCKNTGADIIKKDHGYVQVGGPPLLDESTANFEDEVTEGECKTSAIAFAMPYEVGFVMDFEVDEDNIPTGCAELDEPWISEKYMRHGHTKSKIMLDGYHQTTDAFHSNLICPRPEHALHVDTFAASNDDWQRTFFQAFQKIQSNGYAQEELTIADSAGDLIIRDYDPRLMK